MPASTYCDVSYSNLAEAVINILQAVGIHVRLRPLKRAAFFKGYSEKGYKTSSKEAAESWAVAATRLAVVVKDEA
jgi:peptide/nickel transport system substrate-binding protein